MILAMKFRVTFDSKGTLDAKVTMDPKVTKDSEVTVESKSVRAAHDSCVPVEVYRGK